MLTKQDLSEIKNLLKPINDKLIEHDAQFKKIDVKFEQIDKNFKKIDVKFEQIDKKFDKIDTQFKTVNKKLNKIQKDLDGTIDFFDDYRVKHEMRFDRIESHLSLPTFSTT